MRIDNGKLEEAGSVLSAANGVTHNIVCRRNEPGAQRARAQVPTTYLSSKTGKMEIAKDPRTGETRYTEQDIMQIGHRPTGPEAVCFDGWRKLGTLPGAADELRELIAAQYKAYLDGIQGGTDGDSKAN
jgi:hypothetical protein